jgi:hypothetical protein
LRKAEESPLLEAVARKRLMKSQQAGKRHSGCCGDLKIVEINESAVITCSSSDVYKWSINPFTNPNSLIVRRQIVTTGARSVWID